MLATRAWLLPLSEEKGASSARLGWRVLGGYQQLCLHWRAEAIWEPDEDSTQNPLLLGSPDDPGTAWPGLGEAKPVDQASQASPPAEWSPPACPAPSARPAGSTFPSLTRTWRLVH